MGARHVSPQMKSEELTEHSIQRRLNSFFASWKYNVDGLYVFEWESDKLIWTKAGYIYEFEIKISRADFKNDFKHKKEKHIILQGPTEEERYMPQCYKLYEWNKRNYASLEDYLSKVGPDSSGLIANHRRPNFFYYVVPEGMIQPEEVPPYAGLIWILKEYQYVKQSFVIKKTAPQLHKVKYKDAEFDLARKFYYNWQADRCLRVEAERDREDARKLLREELESKGQQMTYRQMELRMNVVCEEGAHWKEQYARVVRDNLANNAERKRLRKVILQLDPDFDFKPIEEEVDKLYGVLDENRKYENL